MYMVDNILSVSRSLTNWLTLVLWQCVMNISITFFLGVMGFFRVFPTSGFLSVRGALRQKPDVFFLCLAVRLNFFLVSLPAASERCYTCACVVEASVEGSLGTLWVEAGYCFIGLRW